MSETTVGENQASRLSWMAALSFLSGPASWPLIWWSFSSPCQRPVDLGGTPLGKIGLVIVLISPVAAFVLGGLAASRIRRHGRLKGLGLAKMGVVLGFVTLFLQISMPNIISEGCGKTWRPFVGYSSTYGWYSRAAWNAKTAVTQAIVHAQDEGVYPTSIAVLREAGYANIPDKDPWGNEWVLSPVLTQGSEPREGDNVYVFSRGSEGTGMYPEPFKGETGEDGSVGYSSVDGLWWVYR